MYNERAKALALLGLPLLLVISFLAMTATLAEAASIGLPMASLRPGERVLISEIPIDHSGLNFTSPVTGSLIVTGVAVTDIKATSAVVTWTTSEASDSVVRYGTSPGALTLSATNPVTGTAHAVGLANLTPSTEYFMEVESTDDEGDTAVDNNGGAFYSFTTAEAELARRAFVGTVVGDPGEMVTIVRQGTGEEVTIILPDDFILKTPGGPRAGNFEDGARVVILAQRADEDWVALRVLVKPVRPMMPVVGLVTGVGPTSVTVLDLKGNPQLLRLDRQFEGLAPGEVVTVLRDNSNHAKGLVRAEEVRDRLRKHLDSVSQSGATGLDGGDKTFREKRANTLRKSLELHGQHELKALDNALQRAPDHVRDKIRAAKDKVQKDIQAQSSSDKGRGTSGKSGSADESAGPDDRPGPGRGNSHDGNANPDKQKNAVGQSQGKGNSGGSRGSSGS